MVASNNSPERAAATRASLVAQMLDAPETLGIVSCESALTAANYGQMLTDGNLIPKTAAYNHALLEPSLDEVD
jgi:hypothetical protein